MRDAADHQCWKCGAPLAGVPLPLPRLAECPKCRAYLHACRQCQFYDPRLTRKCREERAEEVRDPEGANFCDWFKSNPTPSRPAAGDSRDGGGRGRREQAAENKAAAAKSKLDELFGGKDKE